MSDRPEHRARDIFYNESRFFTAQLYKAKLPTTTEPYLMAIQRALDDGNMIEVAAWAAVAFEFMAGELNEYVDPTVKSSRDTTEGAAPAGYAVRPGAGTRTRTKP